MEKKGYLGLKQCVLGCLSVIGSFLIIISYVRPKTDIIH